MGDADEYGQDDETGDDPSDDLNVMVARFRRANTAIGDLCATMCEEAAKVQMAAESEDDAAKGNTTGAALWVVRLNLGAVMSDTYLSVVFDVYADATGFSGIGAAMPYLGEGGNGLRFAYAYPPILLDVVCEVCSFDDQDTHKWDYAMRHAALMNSAVLHSKPKLRGRNVSLCKLPAAWGKGRDEITVFEEAPASFRDYCCADDAGVGTTFDALSIRRPLVAYGVRVLKSQTKAAEGLAAVTAYLTELVPNSLHVKQQLAMARGGGGATAAGPAPWSKITEINQAGPVAGVHPDNIYYFVSEEQIDTAVVGLATTASMLGTCTHLAFEHAPTIFEPSADADAAAKRTRAIKMTRSLPSVCVAVAVVTYEFLGRDACSGGRSGDVVCPPFLVNNLAIRLRPDAVYVGGEGTDDVRARALELKTVWRKGGFRPPAGSMVSRDVGEAIQAYAQGVGVAAAYGAQNVEADLVHAVVPYVANPKTVSCYRASKTLALKHATAELQCMLLKPKRSNAVTNYSVGLVYVEAGGNDDKLDISSDNELFTLLQHGHFEMRLSAAAYKHRKVEVGSVKLPPTYVKDDSELSTKDGVECTPNSTIAHFRDYGAPSAIMRQPSRRDGQVTRPAEFRKATLYALAKEHGLPLKSLAKAKTMILSSVLDSAGIDIKDMDDANRIAATKGVDKFNTSSAQGRYDTPVYVPYDGYCFAHDPTSVAEQPDIGGDYVATARSEDDPGASAVAGYARAGSNLVRRGTPNTVEGVNAQTLEFVGKLVQLGTSGLGI